MVKQGKNHFTAGYVKPHAMNGGVLIEFEK